MVVGCTRFNVNHGSHMWYPVDSPEIGHGTLYMIGVILLTILNLAAAGFVFILCSTLSKQQITLYLGCVLLPLTLAIVIALALGLIPITLVEIVGLIYRGWFVFCVVLTSAAWYWYHHLKDK